MHTPRLTRLIVSAAAVLAAFAAVTAAAAGPLAAQTEPGDPIDPRTYAPESSPFLAVHAIGVQKYACQANGSWSFTDPEASLYKTADAGKPIGSHYLNFATGRPVWALQDGSSVEAARKASAPGGTGNIAVLLLETAATGAGADGDRLVKTTWVQRLNTSGGVAPAGTCTPGDAIAVPYSTEYVFWKATSAGEDQSDD